MGLLFSGSRHDDVMKKNTELRDVKRFYRQKKTKKYNPKIKCFF